MTRFEERPSSCAPVHRDPYALWDGAYIFGSLSSAERRQYEAHLQGCASCRGAVSELSGMPALLRLLDRDDIVALGADQQLVPPLRPEVGPANQS
ncbi:zf-HC2 domain-containing protein [Mycobacterium sp. AZCC_0083]|uniref:anti-sigma factor family protein n=1 Tax=Mycobacterium sp. AZCC_0083 TaxID=2735882 RepID=UPI00160AE724|nr:anti-sigma factor RsiW [Mycobacterium sp. AZCC_0083]